MNGLSAQTTPPLVAHADHDNTEFEAAPPYETSEVGRLEALLAERGRALSGLSDELTGVQIVLRDALVQMDSLTAGSTPSVAGSSAGLPQAVARAMEAELARAEIAFRLDEVLGHLAFALGTDVASGERMDVTCARLSGTVRGLAAALAETEEARDNAEARLMLVEQDLGDAMLRVRDLQRELASVHDQIQFELIKGRGLETHFQGAMLASQAAALRGEADGLRARSDEAERACIAALTNLELASVSGNALGAELTDTRAKQESRIQALASTLRDARAALLALDGALPTASSTTASAGAIEDASDVWGGDATEPGVPVSLPNHEEQLALRDGRIELLTRALERERRKHTAVAEWIAAQHNGSPLAAEALAELNTLLRA